MKCKFCGKKLKKSLGNKPRKFCNEKCSDKHHLKLENQMYKTNSKFREKRKRIAKKYYYKHKNKKWFKEKNKMYFKKWVKSNRNHFNEIMRKPSREYQRKIKRYRTFHHLCYECGKKLKDDYRRCKSCRERRWKN